MATKEQMLEILVGESGPMNRTVLGKRLGLPTSSFQSQLDRMEKQGLLEKNEQQEYTITEAGRQYALAEPPPGDETPLGEPTDESLKTTEYQQFIEIGKVTGVVPMALISQTANHVWRGGDFRDLTWVWKGLTEMGIRPDLAQRWFHSWRSFLHQAIPPELASSVGVPQTLAGKEAPKTEAVGKGRRDYILGSNDLPLCVGEGVGDLDYDDAVKLSAIRAAAIARSGMAVPGGQSATPGTMADEVTKIFNAFRALTGDQTKGKSYIVKPGEEGYVIEELEGGKPTVIAAPSQSNPPTSSWLIDREGEVIEVPPGKPVVIKQPGAPPVVSQPAKTFIVRQTPEGIVTEEYEVGKPIIINAPSSPGSNMQPMMPFPVMGGDGKPVYDDEGKPVYANLEPMIRYMGFQNEQRRAEERHGALLGMVKTVRENIPDGIQAILLTVAELKGTGSKTPVSGQPQVFRCGDCSTTFSPPAEWKGEPLKCPGCQREYTKEELET